MWLAVELRLLIDYDNFAEEVEVVSVLYKGNYLRANEPYKLDKHKAVRRAIVRAAAVLGNTLG